jgi:hypothetical protein
MSRRVLSSASGPFSSITVISFVRSASVDHRSMSKSTVAVAPVPMLLMLTAKALIRSFSPLVCVAAPGDPISSSAIAAVIEIMCLITFASFANWMSDAGAQPRVTAALAPGLLGGILSDHPITLGARQRCPAEPA